MKDSYSLSDYESRIDAIVVEAKKKLGFANRNSGFIQSELTRLVAREFKTYGTPAESFVCDVGINSRTPFGDALVRLMEIGTIDLKTRTGVKIHGN